MEAFNIISFVLASSTLFVFSLSLVWLIIQAFRRHYLWGLAVLFLPIAQIVFAVAYWDRARRPVLVGLVSLTAFLVVILVTQMVQGLVGT